jgi:hypothetical protein
MYSSFLYFIINKLRAIIMKNESDHYNADHPYCKLAIDIIEQVVEPFLVEFGQSRGLNGEKYYNTESKIITIINQHVK